jgi:single-stranded-DNA-specific exonuclease
MMRSKKWILAPPPPAGFLASVPEHPLLAQVLYNRGLRAADEVRAFLAGVDTQVYNPFKLRDMAPAVQRVVQALRGGETICVYGDFDADGVTATALLVTALQAAGGRAGPYIPNRVDEGYGLNLDAIERIAQQAQLLVTVDCGIRSVAEVAQARRLGLDVIVTDHHTVGPELPPALAVINPRRADCPSRFDRLAGVGVAYRLAQAVLRAAAADHKLALTADQAADAEEDLLDLVALGTVADMMPLLGENRTLVRRGLTRLNRDPRLGIAALMLNADVSKGAVDATAISFRLAPRINAAGRLANAQLAYQLLRTTDATRAFTLAAELEQLNRSRRSLTDAAYAEAEQRLAALLPDDPAIFLVGSERFPAGVVGLVAGKLADRFYRPAVVMELGPEEARGSARSIPEFDISQALDRLSGLLVRHGGHHTAAGFTLKNAHLAEFQAGLQALAEEQLRARAHLRPTLNLDAEVLIEQLDWGLLAQFARLEPTGQDNPPPCLLLRHCRVRGVRTVGNGQHLKLVVDRDPASPVLDAIGFQLGGWKDALGEGSRVDLAFQLEANEWQGNRALQLNLQDLRPAE